MGKGGAVAQAERTVFFDVGNVMIDDDPFLAESFRLIYEAIPAHSLKARPERFWRDVERLMRSHGHAAVERVGSRCLGRNWPKLRKRIQSHIADVWWNLVRMIPGARAALEALRGTYRLGIIANQPPQTLDFLEEQGLLSLFDVVMLDSQRGVGKPSADLFRLALQEAKVGPESAMMVGDRLDNDIVPSRRLGMRAVLLWLDAGEKGWRPEGDWARTFRKILERLPAPRWDSLPVKERPSAVAREWGGLPLAIEAAWEQGP
jgi:FMN phosphatase YigB (HAD superfamily)